MTQLAKSRTGRIVIHLVGLAYRINHFSKPRVGFAVAGIIREVKGN